MVAATSRPARVIIDLGAIARNVRSLADHVAPAALCAVVKADAYGHGAIAVGRTAVDAGADWLGVAVVDEGLALRSAGIDVPILLLSEPAPAAMVDAQAAWLTPTLYTRPGIAAASAAARRGLHPWPVHLKVNTGMNRVGAHSDEVVELARIVMADPMLELGGVWTHLAVADDPGAPETDEQLALYERVLDSLAKAGIDPGIRHAANSGGVLAHPRSRYDLVRPGIALYGIAPSPDVAGRVELDPALSLVARVSFVKSVSAGDRISYGLRHTFDHDTTVATVPVGYADGVARRLGLVGGAVLIGGRRRPIVGVVTMDQLMVDCGDGDVSVGDEVVLLGRQGGEAIGVGEWAELLGSIPYEILCGFGPRLPRESGPAVGQGPVAGAGAGATGATGAVRSTEISELSP